MQEYITGFFLPRIVDTILSVIEVPDANTHLWIIQNKNLNFNAKLMQIDGIYLLFLGPERMFEPLLLYYSYCIT